MHKDVIVVGSGVMGASTAYALARGGVDVTVLEQFALGHKRGSSHGASRIFRLSYPDPAYVAMAQESLPLWRALESDGGERLLTTTGGLDMGKTLDQHVAALEECDAEFEMIDGAEAVRRWPFMSIGRNAPVLYQRDAGIVAADAAVSAFARGARAAGARIDERVRVKAVEPRDDAVRVVTDAGEMTAAVVVVTAGAWARGLLATAGIELATRPTRETVAYFRIPDGHVPPALVDWGSPAIYALSSPGQGIKAGEHIAGPTTDPDDEGRVDEAAVERLARWVGERYPGAEPRLHFAETCLYTNTDDQHFVVRRHDRVVVGSPCSGHGFKFAPLLGRRLAGLAHEALAG